APPHVSPASRPSLSPSQIAATRPPCPARCQGRWRAPRRSPATARLHCREARIKSGPVPWAEGRMQNFLDFEKGLAELEGKAAELRAMAGTDPNLDMSAEADQLEKRAGDLLR